MSEKPGGPDTRPGSTVPVDSIPAPVVTYGVDEGEPVIAGTNERFEAAFEAIPSGTPVRDWLRDGVGADGSSVDDVCSSLADGGGVDAELEITDPGTATLGSGQYHLRTFDESGPDSPSGDPPDSPSGGSLLITEASSDGGADRIASVISHDLRNPLDVAKAHLRAARETGETDHFDQIGRAHDRMEQIIRDVLALARENGSLSITRDVDIEAVASDAWATVDTGGATLTIEDDLPRTEADPDRLQRLFENLFRNSIEHARPTGGAEASGGERHGSAGPDTHLRIRVGGTDGGFFVADNGTGVPAADRTRIFDPGYSRNGRGAGTGLGLTIVKQIAEGHDWTVSLTTGSMEGARFEFLPRGGEATPA
jgi:hypothetical protein